MIQFSRTFGSFLPISRFQTDLRAYGVPVGGPFDTEALRIARTLGPDIQQWHELAMGSCQITGTGTVVVVGPDISGHIDHEPILRAGRYPINTASELSFPRRGIIGIGDTFRPRAVLADPPTVPIELYATPGPQSEVVEGLPLRPLTVSRYIDRRGIRFEPKTQFKHAVELPSEPMAPGVIQITPDGTFIIIGPDGPTIGGYPKPFVLTPWSLSESARLIPGDSVTLTPIGHSKAIELNIEVERSQARRLRQLALA